MERHKKRQRERKHYRNPRVSCNQTFNNDNNNEAGCSQHRSNFSDRPRHLRGKAIGMYYAKRNKELRETNKDQEKKIKGRPLAEVLFSENKKHQIKQLLKNLTCFNEPNEQSYSDKADAYSVIADSEFKEKFLNLISGSIEDKLNDPLLRQSLLRNIDLDIKYYEEFMEKKRSNSQYKQALHNRKVLPSYIKQQEIINELKHNSVVVISGETGCGKTTQVAQFILDDFLMSKNGSICKIVCTQPRRISAISVAERVAYERGEECGGHSVGYHIRLERKLPRPSASIVFCTTGVLIKQMERDPFLSNVSHLILDEIHERDIISDFLITIIKQVITMRPDLKLILMSATLNAQQFSKYYENCAMIHIPGKAFPVESYYLEDILQITKFEFPVRQDVKGWRKHLKHVKAKNKADVDFFDYIQPYVRNLRAEKKYSNKVCDNLLNPNSEELNPNLIIELLKYICTQGVDGSILIFLPGLNNISYLNKEMINSNCFPSYKYLIIPLHSKLTSIQQRQIFNRPPTGMRKIVIATNIAETSITIDDIVYVIDCGKIKMKSYDVENDLETLKPEWVSVANANQRKGRAGRVQPGICYHMFSIPRFQTFEDYPIPEIKRSRLENIILDIKILQLGKTEQFLNNVMDPPDPKAIDNALRLLKHMNALDTEEQLTPLGYHLAKLPVNPKMGKMILLGALFSCLDPILSIAASLDFKDAFQIPIDKQKLADERKRELLKGWKSDHLVLAEAVTQYEIEKLKGNDRNFCWYYFLSSYTLDLLCNMKQQFVEYLCEMKFISTCNMKSRNWNKNSNNLSLIKAIVCASLYPNVAIIKKVTKRMRKVIRTTEHENVELHPSSVNAVEGVFESPLLVYHLKLKSSSIYLHDTTMVHPLPLLFFGDDITIEYIDQLSDNVIISLSNVLRFKCKLETALLIKELRQKLNKLLAYKVSHPGIINWCEDNDEVNILRAIMELITSEDLGDIYYEDEYDSC